MLDIVLGAGARVEDKTNKNPCPHEAFGVGGMGDDNETNQ